VKALGEDGHAPSPERMRALRTSALRAAGLSAAKVLAMKDLARKALAGVVPTLPQAREMSDEELVERLVSVRGIGVWSVEMFLIFRLGRPDVLPIHDLGVRKGWSVAYGKKHMPATKELLAFGERWRPYRTLASWYLWRAASARPRDDHQDRSASGRPGGPRGGAPRVRSAAGGWPGSLAAPPGWTHRSG
jgi:3-methyladenine DNA glycosylase/8-oxoguanine DNA glycosylase